MNVRAYEEKDKAAIERICRDTVTDERLKKNLDAVTLLYADFYVETEPQNVFVAVNDEDECVGYVLCAHSAAAFEENWKNGYLKKIREKSFALYLIQKFSIKNYKKLARKGYEAHLHIDLDESVQRQGLGTKLIDALARHLKKEGVSGVCLDCSPDNVKGNSFYKKYGFTLLKSSPFGNVYGLKLN